LDYLSKKGTFTPDLTLSDHEKRILILCRNQYKGITQALPMFLKAIDWSDPLLVAEAREMVERWAPLEPA